MIKSFYNFYRKQNVMNEEYGNYGENVPPAKRKHETKFILECATIAIVFKEKLCRCQAKPCQCMEILMKYKIIQLLYSTATSYNRYRYLNLKSENVKVISMKPSHSNHSNYLFCNTRSKTENFNLYNLDRYIRKYIDVAMWTTFP